MGNLLMSFNTIRFMSIISFNTSSYSLDGCSLRSEYRGAQSDGCLFIHQYSREMNN